MADGWNEICLRGGDMLLGWSMRVSPNVALLVLSLASAALLLAARSILANQDLLRRAAADKRVLRQRIRQAKRLGDREQVDRLRGVLSTIGTKMLRQEVWPLIIVLPGLALLATWGMQRLVYEPPTPGRPVAVLFITPLSRSGQLVHIVPRDGILAEEGWVRRIQVSSEGASAQASAQWRICPADAGTPEALLFRVEDETIIHDWMGNPVQAHADGISTRILFDQWRPLGVLPGLPWLGITPWLVGYIFLVVPMFYLGKRVLQIR